MTKLSVSSVILAAVLSGCSQQQVIGGSQVSGGSQSLSGGSQLMGSQQQIEGGSQVSGGSQQQIESAAPVVAPIMQPRVQPRVVRPAPIRVYKERVVQPRRIYTRGPKPTRSVRRSSGLSLPAAKPGQCFAKVKVPPTYKTQSRRILISKATSKRVLARAPQYRWLNKRVQVRKAYYKTRTIPAQYRTNVKRVMVKPAYNTWRKGHGAITRIDNMTGEIMCRVQVPAVYKNVTQRILVRPVQKIRSLVPAVYKNVRQKKMIAPALYRTVHTPARYKTQNYRVKAGGARYIWRAVLCKTNAPKNYRKQYHKAAPKQYRKAAPKRQYRKAIVKSRPVVRTAPRKQYHNSLGISHQDYLRVMNAGVSKPKLSKSKKVNKRTVLKKKVMTKKVTAPKRTAKSVNKNAKATKQTIVFGIQKALKAKGFDPGTMDGKMGPGTAAALKAFQSSKGLPVGQLSKDTFRALGLIR